MIAPLRTAFIVALVGVQSVCAVTFTSAAPPLSAETVSVEKIWSEGPHNAFTDLARFNDRWYCVFREGAGHVSADGKVRVLTSDDGKSWKSSALLAHAAGDLRDPKLAVTPDGELMISTVVWTPNHPTRKHQSLAYFSRDGEKWSDPVAIGDENFWLWRTSWHDKVAYNIGYATHGDKQVRLYSSRDARRFQTLVERLDVKNKSPNESAIIWKADGTAYCLLRCEDPNRAQVGIAKAPYRDWTWHALDQAFGGPNLIEHTSGALLAAGRIYTPSAHTSLCWLDVKSKKLVELVNLPSGGDTSYPGLVWHEGLLWMSYYSSHEGKTSVDLAKIKVDAAPSVDP
jgi:hypothetical protein